MADTDPRFIIKYQGKYYLTVGLWVYDETTGTSAQKAGAQAVAAFHAKSATSQSVSVFPPTKENGEFGTAIHMVGTSIDPPDKGGA
jgi:hypothetical protein